MTDTALNKVQPLHNHVVAFSDHLAVSCRIRLGVEYAARGPSYWKLDTNVLSDVTCVPQFRQRWEELLTHRRRFADVAEW